MGTRRIQKEVPPSCSYGIIATSVSCEIQSGAYRLIWRRGYATLIDPNAGTLLLKIQHQVSMTVIKDVVSTLFTHVAL